jgi:steroid 5-alpha reductase family enzyme
VTASTILLAIGAGAAIMMTALWLVQWARRDATIVDVGWSFGLFGAALFLAATADGAVGRRALLAAMTGLWALRLGLHLYLDRIRGRTAEDGRYARMRAAMGRWQQPGFFAFFQVQALFVVIFALPLLGPAFNPLALSSWDAAGAVVWIIAVTGEIMADRQLARFRRDPATKGRTCRVGLWCYSRHPNYFFEWLHWFAYPLMAIGAPHFWLAAAGPVIMGLFLFFVTGIPHTEKQALSTRADYAEYMRTTSIFIPWFPRKETRS